ncbi:MAG: hypothetical protein ACREBC_33030 [Pyrinomonadaceae bacterium]
MEQSPQHPLTSVSAASFSDSTLASEANISAFGSNLATTTLAATTTPLPTSLGGARVLVRGLIGSWSNRVRSRDITL